VGAAALCEDSETPDTVELSPLLSCENLHNLRAGQVIMTEVLSRVDRICREHSLLYWVVGGTLIGAMRHGGWVPWDGDVDIAMTAEHYERWLQVMDRSAPRFARLRRRSGRLPSHMHFTDMPWGQPCSKVVDLRARYKRVVWAQDYYDGLPVQVDLFVFDREGSRLKPRRRAMQDAEIVEIDYATIFPLRELCFSGLRVYVPHKYEEYSARFWGAFPPPLPPIDDRKPHEGNIELVSTAEALAALKHTVTTRYN